MKKIGLFVMLLSMAWGVSAQVTNQIVPVIKTIKGAKVAPANWPFLSFSTDSVYGMEVNRAYDFLKNREKKKKVIVAVIDSGTDTGHEDLNANLWVNPKEIPGNGIDDDQNGFVDDIHGWNFLGKSDGTLVLWGVEETTRQFLLYRGRYDQLVGKKRNKREETELNRLCDLFKESSVGKIYLDLQKAKEEGKQKKITALEERFEMTLGKLNDDRSIIGDRLDDLNDRFYGNTILLASGGPPATALHGTHVAGIIGAVRDNGIGIDGIANHVELMIVRAIPGGDEYDKDVALAIRYAVDNGANIINMSFAKRISPRLKWVQDALKYADKKGVLVVHAAGNNSMNIDQESFYPNPLVGKKRIPSFITVGASNAQGNPSKISNYGKEQVDVFAPGVEIKSTIPQNKYKSTEGTSMAAPMVSGVAAILMTYYPELSASEIRTILIQTATVRRGDTVLKAKGAFSNQWDKVLYSDLCVGGGIVNALEAVKMADRMVSEKK